MTETNEKKAKVEITYVPPVAEMDSDKDWEITYVGASGNSLTKYGVAFEVPTTDEQARERYGVENGLIDLIRMGVKQLTTRPNYQKVGFDLDAKFETTDANGTVRLDAPLVENGHALMQQLADDFRVGRQASGDPSQKALMAEVKAISKETGLSPSEILAQVRAIKAMKDEA